MRAVLGVGIFLTLLAVVITLANMNSEMSDIAGLVYSVSVIAGPSMILLGGLANEIDKRLPRSRKGVGNV